MAALLKAREAWGNDMPDWVHVLASACDETSQNKVAKRLERSAPLVSQVLGKKYPGDMVLIEDLVRGVLMKETISCPVLGETPKQTCRKWRARAGRFQNVNTQYVQMYRACNACPVHLAETDTETPNPEDAPNDLDQDDIRAS